MAEDGTRLPMTVWPARGPGGAEVEPWGVFVALHGMDDYANAFVLAGPRWAELGITTYAYDQRGFGRGAHRGSWPGAGRLAGDVRSACALVRGRHPGARLGVVGESMGGAAAILAFAGPAPARADALVLLSPAVWGWSEQPLPDALLLWLAAHLDPGARLEPPRWVYRSHPASDNHEILRRMGRDKNMIFATRVAAVYGLVDLMERASRALPKLCVPTLYAYGSNDFIVPPQAAVDAVRRLPSGARTALYRRGWHLLDRDLSAGAVLEDAASFLRDPTAPLPSGAEPIPTASGAAKLVRGRSKG